MNSKSILPKTIGWKVNGSTADLASLRYRALIPIIALKASNIDHVLIKDADIYTLSKIDVLIIVKSFTPGDLCLAQQAHLNKTPVFFDLCDNIFLEDYRGKQIVKPSDMLSAILPYLSGIIVTTEKLKEVVLLEYPNFNNVYVVPDGIETKKTLEQSKNIIKNSFRDKSSREQTIDKSFSNIYRFALLKIKLTLNYLKINILNLTKPRVLLKQLYLIYDIARSKLLGRPRKFVRVKPFFSADLYLAGKKISKKEIPDKTIKLLWFGNHGAKYANFGILDLLQWRKSIEKLNKEFPVELVVISNNRERFLKYISRFNCYSRYLEWSSDLVEKTLLISDVCLIPNSKDEFSICKSPNRSVLAIRANVPVVATLTPALEELSDVIYHGDPYNEIINIVKNKSEVEDKINYGKILIEKLYGMEAINRCYCNILKSIKTPSNQEENTEARYLLAINLIQDFELAAPLIKELKLRRKTLTIFISFSLAGKSPKTLKFLTDEKVRYFCIPDDIAFIKTKVLDLFGRADCLVTFAETNLGPHKFSRGLTELATDNNIATYTFQHGLENIGLTFSDNIHNVSKIEILSDHIFIWGERNTLLPEVKEEVRRKTIPVGCTKPIMNIIELETPLDDIQGTIIGVFENLHWHRFSESYRELFLNSLEICSKEFPSVYFFVKPHPAGMWLTNRFKGQVPKSDNIIIAEPNDKKWEAPTFNDYMRKLNAVISTPSTVILDSVRAGKPTLVCEFDLDLKLYTPLPKACSQRDWINFVSKVRDSGNLNFDDNNEEFLNKVIVPGNALSKVIEILENRDKRVLNVR